MKKPNLTLDHVCPHLGLCQPSCCGPVHPLPRSFLCSNMIRLTGMFKWVILFIHCCCLAPDITKRIKATESQQEVRWGEKGNVVFCLHPASVSEFISAVTADRLLAAACSAVDHPPSTGCVCVCVCALVLKQVKTRESCMLQ